MINGFELLPSLGKVYCRGILLQFARLHLNEGEILQVETTVNEKKITKRSPHYNDSLSHVRNAGRFGMCKSFSVVLERASVVNKLPGLLQALESFIQIVIT